MGAPVAALTARLAPLVERWLWPVQVGVVVVALYIVYARWLWAGYAIRSWDLGIFTQLLKQYAALSAPIVDIRGDGFNLLGDHFHPLLVVLAPVSALFPGAFTLLVIQSVCFGIAAAVVTRSAQALLGPVQGGLFGLAFGLSWGLQYAADVQFHEVAMAVPLLAVSLTGVLEQRWKRAAIAAALLVFVKEDLGLTVVAIGLVMVLCGRRRLGIGLAVWGAAWLLLAVLVILPVLSGSGEYPYSRNLPTGGFDPGTLVDPRKVETVTLLLVATAGVALRSPISLVLIPTLAWRFLSPNDGYWGPSWHYSAALMPIAFVAALDGIRRSRVSPRAWLRRYSAHAAVIMVTVGVVLLPRLPMWNAVVDWDPQTERTVAASRVLASVPAGASVETDIGLMSYLVADHHVFWLGNENPPADCILIDRGGGGTPDEWGGVLDVAELLHPEVSYELVRRVGDYELACRAAPAEPIPEQQGIEKSRQRPTPITG
jgi:uncharacterized membrane protein